MKRSKESHELPQGLTPRPYQPGSSTVLFIALNHAPTIWGRAIVPARTPLSPYLSLTPRLSIAMARRYRAVIYGDIKSGPNYCRVIAQFGADAASIRRRHLRGEIRRIVKKERGGNRQHMQWTLAGQKNSLPSTARFQMRTARVKY